MIVIPRRAANIVKAAATRNLGRQALEAIRIREFEDQFWLEATDGRVLVVARGPLVEAPNLRRPRLKGPAVFEYFLGSEEWKAAWQDGPEALAFASDGRSVFACSTDGERAFEALNVRWPDTAKVIEDCGGKGLVTCRVNPDLLGRVAALAGAFASRGEEEAIRLVFSGADKPLTFSVAPGEGHTLEGLLMPMTRDDPAEVGFTPGTQEECKAAPAGPRPGPGMNVAHRPGLNGRVGKRKKK